MYLCLRIFSVQANRWWHTPVDHGIIDFNQSLSHQLPTFSLIYWLHKGDRLQWRLFMSVLTLSPWFAILIYNHPSFQKGAVFILLRTIIGQRQKICLTLFKCEMWKIFLNSFYRLWLMLNHTCCGCLSVVHYVRLFGSWWFMASCHLQSYGLLACIASKSASVDTVMITILFALTSKCTFLHSQTVMLCKFNIDKRKKLQMWHFVLSLFLHRKLDISTAWSKKKNFRWINYIM